MKYRYIGLVLIGLFAGCAQLLNGQEQPVIVKNSKEGIYYTTCSGAVEDFGTCNRKAMAKCPSGYLVKDKYQDSNGAIRSITFQCKN